MSEIEVKNIDHLGIVAGLIDEIGIEKIINNKLGIDKREKISAVKVVKAIIINGLGMVSRPLYLFSRFFEDKDEPKKTKKLLNDDGYTWKEQIVTYGGIKQVWLIVSSKKRQKSDLEKLDKKLKQEEEKSQKLLKKFQSEEFTHPQAASYKLKGINRKLRFFAIAEVDLIEARSKKTEPSYKIIGMVRKKNEEIAKRKKEAGRFILATNLVDKDKLEPEEIIVTYKNQQSSERGFRFLKDPLFFTDSFFLENPSRIETMYNVIFNVFFMIQIEVRSLGYK